jgi:hypothetical protein
VDHRAAALVARRSRGKRVTTPAGNPDLFFRNISGARNVARAYHSQFMTGSADKIPA